MFGKFFCGNCFLFFFFFVWPQICGNCEGGDVNMKSFSIFNENEGKVMAGRQAGLLPRDHNRPAAADHDDDYDDHHKW